LKPITAEMAGKYATVVFGFVNMFGNIAGFVAPKLMGAILEGKNQGDPESWRMVFVIPGKNDLKFKS
jgi:nitrate/nitrite transporter NarK